MFCFIKKEEAAPLPEKYQQEAFKRRQLPQKQD